MPIKEMLQEIKKLNSEVLDGLKFKESDVQKVPFGSDSIDVVDYFVDVRGRDDKSSLAWASCDDKKLHVSRVGIESAAQSIGVSVSAVATYVLYLLCYSCQTRDGEITLPRSVFDVSAGRGAFVK